MNQLKPYSALVLVFAGLLLAAMGVYFMLIRPPLVPEDFRYMKATLPFIDNAAPDLPNWLQKVWWVMGGYIFTPGLLTVFIASTSFGTRLPGSFIIVVIAGISSIISFFRSLGYCNNSLPAYKLNTQNGTSNSAAKIYLPHASADNAG